MYADIYKTNGLYVDDVNKKIAIWNQDQAEIFKYQDLNGYELVENGTSILQGRMGSAIIGGLAFGVAGAIVGSAMSRESSSMCESLTMNIMINNLNSSIKKITFLDKKCPKDSDMYRVAKNSAEELIGIFKYLEREIKQHRTME